MPCFRKKPREGKKAGPARAAAQAHCPRVCRHARTARERGKRCVIQVQQCRVAYAGISHQSRERADPVALGSKATLDVPVRPTRVNEPLR